MYEFLNALVKTLQRCGIVDVRQSGSTLFVSGVEYYCYTKGKTSIVVEGTSFRSPLKNVDKVALYIIQNLPAKLERKKENEKNRERSNFAHGINESINGTNMSVSTYYGEEKFTLTASYEDKESLMAAIDWLQEGGFCFNKDEAVFRQRWAQSAMDNLTGEEVEEFLLRTIKSLPKEKMKPILNALLSETE